MKRAGVSIGLLLVASVLVLATTWLRRTRPELVDPSPVKSTSPQTQQPAVPKSPAFRPRPQAPEQTPVRLGTRGELVLDLEKLELLRVWEDGTTQYRYDDRMLVTILATGEVLLLPDEI